jgi:nicotinamide phosphoribosyltransferase
MAIKATYGVVNGKPRELFKDPVTDNGTKKSAKGLLRVEEIDGNFVLFDQQTLAQELQGELVRVFEDGVHYNVQTLDEVRKRLHP